MKKNSWYEFRAAKGGKPVSILIEGEIGAWGISAKSFRSEFARIGDTENISLHICSGGGSVFDGQEIANIIRGHKGEVHITLGSICASIATVIACAGTTVTAAKNTLYMVHRVSGGSWGDADDLRKTAEIMEKLEAGIVTAYAARTGLAEKDLEAMMDDETWLDADEAKAQGFIDEVSEDAADDDEVENVDLSHYKNLSKLLQGEIANEIAASITGNGKRPTLALIKNAVRTAEQPQPQKETVPPPPMKTDAELAADNAAKIEAGIAAGIKAIAARAKEINTAVAMRKERDKLDFSALAEEYLNDTTKSVDQFFRDMNDSAKGKPTNVVGSGIELIEPLDSSKGTPGFAFVTSPEFMAIHEYVKKNGRPMQGGASMQAETPAFRNVQTSTATSGSGLTSIEKLPGVMALGVRPLTVEDLISGGVTGNTTIRYIQEVTYTEAAASVAETGALPELTVTYQEIDAAVKDIGGYLKMSENLLADYLAVASFINARVPYQVDRAVDDQLLNGDGTGTNITGILASAGVQTLALGALTPFDLALKLQTLVRWQAMTAGQAQGGFEPDGYIVHPTDWERLVLIKDANGQYLCRGPFTGSYGNALGGPEMIEFYTLWGKKVAISPVTTQGTIVCGAFKMNAQAFNRQGLIIEMSNSDGTDFLSRKVTLRGTRRLALAVYRPASFATGTGL